MANCVSVVSDLFVKIVTTVWQEMVHPAGNFNANSIVLYYVCCLRGNRSRYNGIADETHSIHCFIPTQFIIITELVPLTEFSAFEFIFPFGDNNHFHPLNDFSV